MKNIGIIVTVVISLLTVAVGYGSLKNESKTNKEKVEKIEEKHEEKLEKHDEEIDELEKYAIKQSIITERTLKVLEDLEKKIK